MESVRILIVDEVLLFRDVLHRLLQRCADFRVVEDVGTQAAAQRVVLGRQIDVVVLASGMPSLRGLELIHDLKALHPPLKILALAGPSDLTDVARALAAGADGFLTRDELLGELIGAIRHVAHGGRYICPDIAHAFAMRGILSETGKLPPRTAHAVRH